MRYLFFIFPAYLFYVLTVSQKNSWGFDFLWMLEIVIGQLIVFIISLLFTALITPNHLPEFRQVGIYAFLVSIVAVLARASL